MTEETYITTYSLEYKHDPEIGSYPIGIQDNRDEKADEDLEWWFKFVFAATHGRWLNTLMRGGKCVY